MSTVDNLAKPNLINGLIFGINLVLRPANGRLSRSDSQVQPVMRGLKTRSGSSTSTRHRPLITQANVVLVR